MDLNDTPEQAEYRAAARAWLEANRDQAPPRSGSLEDTDYVDPRRAWQRKLAEAGLAAVTWPTEFGGRGLGPIEQVTVNQEIQRAQVPGILDVIGIGMLGPCLIAHGTEEQKSRYLGPLLHGDEVWCQMFSEPGAGSDLAAVQTRARQDEDGSWTLNGQKVWTTNAQFASFGLLLARTDPDVPKHKGLTMFIVPMDAAGVTHSRAAPDLRRGRVQRGLLRRRPPRRRRGGRRRRERLGHSADGAHVRAPDDRLRVRVVRLADPAGPDPGRATPAPGTTADARRRLGEVITELLAVRYNGYRALTALSRGQIPGPEAGLAKVTMVNAAIAATDLGADVVGPDALDTDSEWSYLISFLPGLKSAGGTEQVLRNTIGERVLGLPPEPRLDKGVPFSELRAMEKQAVTS